MLAGVRRDLAEFNLCGVEGDGLAGSVEDHIDRLLTAERSCVQVWRQGQFIVLRMNTTGKALRFNRCSEKETHCDTEKNRIANRHEHSWNKTTTATNDGDEFVALLSDSTHAKPCGTVLLNRYSGSIQSSSRAQTLPVLGNETPPNGYRTIILHERMPVRKSCQDAKEVIRHRLTVQIVDEPAQQR